MQSCPSQQSWGSPICTAVLKSDTHCGRAAIYSASVSWACHWAVYMMLSGESSQHRQCSFPQSTTVCKPLFPHCSLRHHNSWMWKSTCLCMCSCPSSRYCSYLRFSRQECISVRLPNIKNLQLVLFPKMWTELKRKDSTSCCHCLTSICSYFSVLPLSSFLVPFILPEVPCAASG